MISVCPEMGFAFGLPISRLLFCSYHLEFIICYNYAGLMVTVISGAFISKYCAISYLGNTVGSLLVVFMLNGASLMGAAAMETSLTVSH